MVADFLPLLVPHDLWPRVSRRLADEGRHPSLHARLVIGRS